MNKPLLACTAGLAALLAGATFAQSGADRVVARIGDEKVTLGDVQAELPPAQAGNLQAQKAALQSIVTRKIIAQEAVRQKLDKTPVGAMIIKRAEEGAIVGILEQKLVGTPPKIPDDQVRAFVAGNP